MKTCLKCGSEMSDYATVCGVCDTPVSTTTASDYDVTVPAPKKNKKGLLWGLIGGGIGLIVLVAVLCFVFCGGSVEFGMDFADSQSAMEANDFFCANHYFDSSFTYSTYEGEIDELGGNAVVNLSFNDNDALDSVFIECYCDINTAKDFLGKELDVTFDEYTARDMYEAEYPDQIYETVLRYVARNSKYIVIIKEYCQYERKDGKRVDISIYSLDNLHKSDLTYAENNIDEIIELHNNTN